MPIKPVPKVMVIGLDGVCLDNIRPLLKLGRLPNIARLIGKGVVANLKSVYPPMTPVAWPSFSTGKNPGKHGVFGWWEMTVGRQGEQTLTPVSSASIKSKPLWKILSDDGKRVGVINVPVTYPATPVDGFMLCGFDNPFESTPLYSDLTYPPDIISTLRNRGIDYRVMDTISSERPLHGSEMVSSFQEWKEIETERTKAALWLQKEHRPHFMMIVYHIADYFMHRCRHSSSLVESAFELLDSCIGELVQCCGDDTTILIVSDHGSIELNKYIFLQNWLANKDLLCFKEILPIENLKFIIRNLGAISFSGNKITEENVDILWPSIPNDIKRDVTKELKNLYPGCCVSDSNIEWTKTKVFPISSYGELYINSSDRFPNGVVRDSTQFCDLEKFLIAELSDLRDPDTGLLLMSLVTSKEKYYQGENTAFAPDVLCFLRDHSYYFMRYSHFMRPSTHLATLMMNTEIVVRRVTDKDDYIGDHTPDGIFIAVGPSVKSKKDPVSINITDVAPTVLALCETAIPCDMDGAPLHHLFDFSPVSFSGPDPTGSKFYNNSNCKNNDAEVLRKRLQHLGYNV